MLYRNKWLNGTLDIEHCVVYKMLIDRKLITNHKATVIKPDSVIVEYESDLSVDELKEYIKR